MEVHAQLKVSKSKDHPGELDVMVDIVLPVVDRPITHGWIMPTDEKLIERLRLAVESGAAIMNPVWKTDVFGKSYIQFDTVSAKRMKSDLRRLGY